MHTYLIGTFASFFSREYILFWAHIETINMLKGSIHPAKTPFLTFIRDFSDFYPLQASIGETHLPR